MSPTESTNVRALYTFSGHLKQPLSRDHGLVWPHHDLLFHVAQVQFSLKYMHISCDLLDIDVCTYACV